MHTEPMTDDEGDFGDAQESSRKCGKCCAPMLVQTWSSHCGGYEDFRYTCPVCGHVAWVEGIDS